MGEMGTSSRTRVLVIDDHAFLVVTLKDRLTFCGYEVVGTASSAKSARKMAGDVPADVAILDLKLGDDDGLAVMTDILNKRQGLHIVILSAISGGHAVRQALDLGAMGYVAKESPIEEVLAAVNTTAMGCRYLCPIAAQALNESSALPLPTERERNVLRMHVQGHSAKEAAALAAVTVSTMQSYRKEVMKKLRLETNRDAINYASRNGLLH